MKQATIITTITVLALLGCVASDSQKVLSKMEATAKEMHELTEKKNTTKEELVSIAKRVNTLEMNWAAAETNAAEKEIKKYRTLQAEISSAGVKLFQEVK